MPISANYSYTNRYRHDKVCSSLVAGLWFSPATLVSSTNKTDRYDIAEILLKVALHTTPPSRLSTYVRLIFHCWI